MNRTFKMITAIFLGSVLEWYDFAIFIYLMPLIGEYFFPSQTHYMAIIYGYCILAISYLIRPLGGILFGRLGDQKGKSYALILTLLCMSLPSLFIGLLPGYQHIGILAPLLLIILRLIQGLSAGGELMGAVILTYEISKPSQREPLSCLVWVGSGFGILLGTICINLLTDHFGQKNMQEWAWRIPFFIGAGLGIVALYIRRYALTKKQVFKSQNGSFKDTTTPLNIIAVISRHKMLLTKLFMYFIPCACIFYLTFIFMPTYASQVGLFSYEKALHINTYVIPTLQIGPVLSCYLLKNHSKQMVMRLSLISLIVLSLPLYHIITTLHEASHLLMIQFVLALCISIYAGAAMPKALAITPSHSRYTLLGLAYNLSFAIFGNAIPIFSIYMMYKMQFWLLPAITITLTCLLTLFSLLIFSRKTNFNHLGLHA